MKNLFILSSFIFFAASCGDSSFNHTKAGEGGYRSDIAQGTVTSESSDDIAEQPGAENRKLIKTGSVSFETESLIETRNRIYQAIDKYKAYVSEDRENKYYNNNQNTIEIRVPEKNFDLLLADISVGVESFDDKNISVQDVTEEYVDIEARLVAKKALEARYLELLKEAKDVEEMLVVEGHIGTVRTEIERIEGKLNFLKSQVSFSTLSITFYEHFEPIEKKHESNKFLKGLNNGWNGVVLFFVALTNIWPLILIGLITWYFVRRYLKKQKSRN